MRNYVVIACLISIGVFTQAHGQGKFSIDVGATQFLDISPDTSVLNQLGYDDISKWTTAETLVTPHIAANIHVKEWTLGMGLQRRHSYDMTISRSANPNVDRVTTSNSWWSAYAERRFRLHRNYHTFLTAGVARTKTNGFTRREANASRVELVETDPFLRIGLSREYKSVEARVDYTKRFTESDDFANLLRLSVRKSFD